MKRNRLHRLVGFVLCLGILTSVGVIWSTSRSTASDPDTEPAEASDTIVETEAPETEPDLDDEPEPIQGRIASRQVFADALMRHGLTHEQVFELVRAIRSGVHRAEFNPDVVQSGDRYTLAVDTSGIVQSFEYVRKGSLETRFLAERQPDGRLKAWKERFPLDREVVVVSGHIDDTLWNALSASGERPDYLSSKMTEIFEYDIDFMVDCRRGDRFTFVVEKFFKDGAFVRYGDYLIAAEYRQERDTYKAFLYETPDGDAAYYDQNGKSLRGLFLKSPLNYRRISSGFNRRRFHPILKKYIPHHGIDYAADYGTKVWATADGVISFIGRKGALGNYVEIKHKNGYVTGYGHLSRFRRGLKKGARVKQKELVGYVGATGRATGPHLHYNFIVTEGGQRRYVDAATVVNRPTGKPVPISKMDHFRRHRDSLWALLRQVSDGPVTASLNVTEEYHAALSGRGPAPTE